MSCAFTFIIFLPSNCTPRSKCPVHVFGYNLTRKFERASRGMVRRCPQFALSSGARPFDSGSVRYSARSNFFFHSLSVSIRMCVTHAHLASPTSSSQSFSYRWDRTTQGPFTAALSSPYLTPVGLDSIPAFRVLFALMPLASIDSFQVSSMSEASHCRKHKIFVKYSSNRPPSGLSSVARVLWDC
ncbi:hypothetical protein C8R46DRAFT_1123759 [Mycena filopes]|nr:hypothetical protein C8R46DRAFT_1123759 [Mycena filopes]